MTKVFQEKHTNGHLWWKITYYKYFLFDGYVMRQLPILSSDFLKSVEKGK